MRQQHLLGFAGEKKAPAKERSWLEAWCRVWWKLLGFPCSNFPKTGYSNSMYHYLFYWTQRHPRRNSSCAFATRSWIARPRQRLTAKACLLRSLGQTLPLPHVRELLVQPTSWSWRNSPFFFTCWARVSP